MKHIFNVKKLLLKSLIDIYKDLNVFVLDFFAWRLISVSRGSG